MISAWVLLVPILLLFAPAPARAQLSAGPMLPEVAAESAILLDYTTGTVLYEKNADAERSPASLTKLFTLHLIYNKIEEGAIRLDDRVEITTEAWAARMPGSSLMFLEPGQQVTVAELMQGLAVCSGNDAALALARHASGSVAAFVEEMNAEAGRLGYRRFHFVDPSGLSGRNRITAREFAEFSRLYIRLHPQSLPDLHSVLEMSYPLARNMPPGRPWSTNTIRQFNTNELLAFYEGVDGLKTGFIHESGYNYALTALKGNMRLVAVSLGGPGASPREGNRNRNQDGMTLLSYGFDNYMNIQPRVAAPWTMKVWNGRSRTLDVVPEELPVLTILQTDLDSLSQIVLLPASVTAPVLPGQSIGEIVFKAGGVIVDRAALVAGSGIPRGGLFIRLWTAVRRFFGSIFAPEHPLIQESPLGYQPAGV